MNKDIKLIHDRLIHATGAGNLSDIAPQNRYIIIAKILAKNPEGGGTDPDIPEYTYDWVEVEYMPDRPRSGADAGKWITTGVGKAAGSGPTAAVAVDESIDIDEDDRVVIFTDVSPKGDHRYYIIASIPFPCEIDMTAAQEMGSYADEHLAQTDTWAACGDDPLIYWIDSRVHYEVDSGTNIAEFIKYSRPHHYTKDGRLVYVGEEVREVMFSTVEFACPEGTSDPDPTPVPDYVITGDANSDSGIPDGDYFATGATHNGEPVYERDDGIFVMWKGTNWALSPGIDDTTPTLWIRTGTLSRDGGYTTPGGAGRNSTGTATVSLGS